MCLPAKRTLRALHCEKPEGLRRARGWSCCPRLRSRRLPACLAAARRPSRLRSSRVRLPGP